MDADNKMMRDCLDAALETLTKVQTTIPMSPERAREIIDAKEALRAEKERYVVVFTDHEVCDMKDKPCMVSTCAGTYTETSIHDDWDGVLHCNICNDVTDRRVVVTDKKI